MIPFEQTGKKCRTKCHETYGKRQTEYENERVLARDPGNGKHVVKRHGDVSNDNLHDRLAG